VREGVRAVCISKCLLGRSPGPPGPYLCTAVTRGLFHSGLGLDVHHPDGGLAQRSQGYPSPANHYQQSTHQHRSRCALDPDRRRVHVPNVLVVHNLAYYFQGSESHYKYFLTTVILYL
jgi:hypothetical protein